MGRVRYSYGRSTGTRSSSSADFDPEVTAKAMAYELHVSPKHVFEICRAIKGMNAVKAEKYLGEVIEKKRPIPFKRHKKKVGHRKSLNGWYAGRYPRNATGEIVKLIRDAKSNAEYKGVDGETMRRAHIAMKKGRTIRGIMPRAFERATAKNTETVTVEIVLKEEGT
jgi:large subunit ribosomal protein L22